MPNADVVIQRVSVAEMIKKLKELSTKPKEKQTMNEREYEELIKLLEDDFDGDFTITRKSLLEYLNKAKWNANKPETTTVCITYKVAVMNFGGEGVQLLLYGPESYECVEESDSFICWDTEERIVEVEVEV
jgi:hypothetical protein